MLRELFSADSNRALFATSKRKLLIGSITVGWLLIAAFFYAVFPWWWGWAFTSLAIIVGEMFLGRHWANKDLLAQLGREDS